MAEESATAARGQAGCGFLLAGVMQDQYRHTLRSQASQRHEGLEHGGGVVFAPAREKRRERVDDGESHVAFGAEAGDAFDQGEPIGCGRLAGEGTAEPADVVAEVELAAAKLPEVSRFLGDDDGFAGREGQAGELATGLELGQENGDEGSLSRLPLTGEKRDRARN
jgi:hypothetical protein